MSLGLAVLVRSQLGRFFSLRFSGPVVMAICKLGVNTARDGLLACLVDQQPCLRSWCVFNGSQLSPGSVPSGLHLHRGHHYRSLGFGLFTLCARQHSFTCREFWALVLLSASFVEVEAVSGVHLWFLGLTQDLSYDNQLIVSWIICH